MSHERLQLLLPFPHVPGYDARDFMPAASNNQALTWLDASWPDQRLALWGPAGSGKSHLLHIWADRMDAPVLAGQALQTLDSMPHAGALALDDADTVAPQSLLLHLLNTARDRNLRLLLSGRAPPSRWPVDLPDLSSRLRAIAAVEIQSPSDDLLATLLMRLLADRQLTVSLAVQDWLLTQLPRSPASLRNAVTRLDRASLALARPITRGFAAKVLADEETALSEADEPDIAGGDPSTQAPRFL